MAGGCSPFRTYLEMKVLIKRHGKVGEARWAKRRGKQHTRLGRLNASFLLRTSAGGDDIGLAARVGINLFGKEEELH